MPCNSCQNSVQAAVLGRMLQGLDHGCLGLVDTIQPRIGHRQVLIAANGVGFQLNCFATFVERVFILPELVVDVPQIVGRGRVARIGLFVKFQRRDALVVLPAVGIVVRHDIELLALAGPVAQLERLLPIFFREHTLPKISVSRSEPCIRRCEVRIELDGSLIFRNRGQLIARRMLGIAASKCVQRVERGRRRLRQHHIIFLDRCERFAQAPAQLRIGFVQGVQHIISIRSLRFRPRQNVPVRRIDCLQRDRIPVAHVRDAAR